MCVLEGGGGGGGVVYAWVFCICSLLTSWHSCKSLAPASFLNWSFQVRFSNNQLFCFLPTCGRKKASSLREVILYKYCLWHRTCLRPWFISTAMASWRRGTKDVCQFSANFLMKVLRGVHVCLGVEFMLEFSGQCCTNERKQLSETFTFNLVYNKHTHISKHLRWHLSFI